MEINVYQWAPRTATTLRLVPRGDRVLLVAVDPDTGVTFPGGLLLTISEKGVFLNPHLDSDGTGFEVDVNGELRLLASKDAL